MNSFCKKTRYLFTNAFILIMFYSVITAVAYTSWAVIDLQKSRASLTTQQVVSDETFQISSSAPDNSTTLVFVFGLVLGLLILDVWNILDYWIQAKYEEWIEDELSLPMVFFDNDDIADLEPFKRTIIEAFESVLPE